MQKWLLIGSHFCLKAPAGPPFAWGYMPDGIWIRDWHRFATDVSCLTALAICANMWRSIYKYCAPLALGGVGFGCRFGNAIVYDIVMHTAAYVYKYCAPLALGGVGFG